MLTPFNVYNSNLGKDFYLTKSEIEALKADIAARGA